MSPRSLGAALLVVIAACSPAAPPAPAPRTIPVATVASAPPIAVAAPPIDAAPSLPALAVSLDGVWEFAETCEGASTTYTLTVDGPRAELVTTAPSGTRSQSLELVAAKERGGRTVGALATPTGDRSTPLFRLYRDGPVLSRFSLGDDATPVALAEGASAGSFVPRCTSFASFIERSEVAKQAWARTTLGGLSFSYPSQVFRSPARTSKRITLAAPSVNATTMNGQPASFAIHVSIEKESPRAILSKIIARTWDESVEGPMIAGSRGIEIQLGIEGVGHHHVAVPLKSGATLVTVIEWVSSFANANLTMSQEMQLAIADRVLASIEVTTKK